MFMSVQTVVGLSRMPTPTKDEPAAMKNLEDKIILAFYGVFGGFLGFLIFAVALGGWSYLLTNRPAKPWNGLVALIICLALGSGWGLVSYKFRNREFGSGASSLFEDKAT